MASHPSPRQLGTLRVLTAAALFGTTGTVLARAPDGAGALAVGAVRLAIGGPLLLVVAVATGHRPRALARFWRGTAVGALGVVAFQLLYFVSTTRTGVALGTVVTIGSGPVFSGLVHAVRTGHRPSAAWVLGTTCGVAGVSLLAITGDTARVDGLGVLAALGAGLGWATFATIGKDQIDRGLASTTSLGGLFSVAAVLTSPLLFVEPMGWITGARGVVVAVYLGAATLTLAYTLYGMALRVLPAHTVITLTLLEPITAAVLAAVVVGETITPLGWAGVCLVLTGLVLTARAATVADDEHAGHPEHTAVDARDGQHPGGAAADPAEPTRR